MVNITSTKILNLIAMLADNPKIAIKVNDSLEAMDVLGESLGGEATFSSEKMKNGEVRIRVTVKNKLSIIIVINGSGKQNPHCHLNNRETWFVLFGTQILYEIDDDGKEHVTIMKPGDTASSTLGRPHNCWLSNGACTVTIKTLGEGVPEGSEFDWIAADEEDFFGFDLVIENFISESECEKM